MYKKINSFNFSSIMFNSEIDNHFKGCTNKFITELESSLLRKFVCDDTELPFTFLHEEQKVLRDFLRPSNGFPLEINWSTGLEILVTLLTIKMEEYLIVPFNTLDEQKQKDNEKEILSFEKYLDNYSYGAKCSLEERMKDIEKIDVDVLKFPSYFLFYRARNILASKLQERKYSIKALNKFIGKINEHFEDYLYDRIIELKRRDLTFHDKNAIYEMLENELLNGFLMDIRLGKTGEEGDKLVIKVRNVIEEEQIRKHMKSEMWDSFNHEIAEGEADSFLVNWTKTFKEELERQFQSIKLEDIDEDIEFYPYPIPGKSIKRIVLSAIFNEDNYVGLIDSSFTRIKENDKTQFIQRLCEMYLKTSTFSVAICVKDIKTDDVYLNSSLIPDVTVMSREMFKSWQYNIYPDYTERRILVDNSGLKNATWFVVDGIQCAVSDMDRAYSLAKEKVRNLLNFLYHFISREDQINFEIVDPYIIVDRTNTRETLGRMEHPGKYEAKNIDDLENELLKFTVKFFENSSIERDMVLNAINYYNKVGKTDNVEEKMRLLSSSCKAIFGTSDYQNLSVYCAIVVAGTNYHSDDVTYGEMRRWLIDDFCEFFYVAERDGLVPLKEQIFERFKVFSKIIIRTILFNLIPVNKESRYRVQKVLEWILTINPNEETIVRRDI